MAEPRPSLAALAQRRRLLNGLYAGTYWKHLASGSLYLIESIGIRESDYEPMVHYAPLTVPDMQFDRPLKEWVEMTDPEQKNPRFKRVMPKVTYE